MKIGHLDQPNEEKFSKTLKVEQDNQLCKDGFCSLPNHNKNSSLDKNDLDFFDPV